MSSWLTLFVSVLFVIQFTNAQNIETAFQWKQLDYGFPTEADKQEAIDNGNFILKNTIPIEVAPHYLQNGTRRVFVSSPRFMNGVPYSFATVDDNGQLHPYPDYSWHSSHGADCDGITSAFRVAFTPCNQMWLIDAGGGSGRCAPQLLLFDLATDKLIHRYRFPANLYAVGASAMITVAVKVDDPEAQCEKTTVYVADTGYHGLVIYDYAQKAGWRAQHRFMYPDPEKGKITLAGDTFTLMDGIFGLAVSKDNLYFNPLASHHEYSVSLKTLADRTAFEQSNSAHEDQFKQIGSRRNGCASKIVDSRDNIYCVGFNPVSLLKWNTATKYKTSNIRSISKEEDILQFASGLKVVKNPEGQEELWLMTNRYQKFATGILKPDEVNFRVLKLDLN